MNQDAALRLYKNLTLLFPSFVSSFHEGETPQQSNSYDCGVYVLALSKDIGKVWKRNGQKVETDWW